jgi:hypothetical protein
MSRVKVTIEHPGAHEPDGETFKADLSKGITSALHAEGLKRGEGDPVIVGYTQESGVSTTYTVELDTEPAAKSNTGGGNNSADAKNADTKK